jgi:hypothetical protein
MTTHVDLGSDNDKQAPAPPSRGWQSPGFQWSHLRGRSVRVSLTTQARALVPEVTAAIGDRIKPLTGQLSAAEQKRLTALLTKALGS